MFCIEEDAPLFQFFYLVALFTGERCYIFLLLFAFLMCITLYKVCFLELFSFLNLQELLTLGHGFAIVIIILNVVHGISNPNIGIIKEVKIVYM